ncbi:hypothetical protein Tco_1193034 [Tanacetum coccineum]
MNTFHVSNLKKCLGNANLHVPLNEIKIDKTLRFVEEPVEIMDHEVKSLKHSRIPLVKVCWNSKRGPEFTWEREDYMKSKYPQLFVDHALVFDIVWKIAWHQVVMCCVKDALGLYVALLYAPHFIRSFAWGLPLQKDVGDTINWNKSTPEYKPTKEEEENFKLKAIYENVIYDISDSDSDLESTARSGPRDSEMEDTGSSGMRINA